MHENSCKSLTIQALQTSRGGIITVGIKKKSNSQIIVYVKDNGNGIDSEIFPSLFTKFASKSDNGLHPVFICLLLLSL